MPGGRDAPATGASLPGLRLGRRTSGAGGGSAERAEAGRERAAAEAQGKPSSEAGIPLWQGDVDSLDSCSESTPASAPLSRLFRRRGDVGSETAVRVGVSMRQRSAEHYPTRQRKGRALMQSRHVTGLVSQREQNPLSEHSKSHTGTRNPRTDCTPGTTDTQGSADQSPGFEKNLSGRLLATWHWGLGGLGWLCGYAGATSCLEEMAASRAVTKSSL
ncbi:hypothetical protein JHW43_004223 [Diplocarpon mali]|nr:hypothetical protein JHW43_004223 [Diplocarpon mali]